MSGKTLRPYQTECVEAVLRDLSAGYKKVLYVLPTGAGKTVTFCELSKRLLAEGFKVLVLVHRQTLMEQAFKELLHYTGIHPFEITMEQGSMKANAGHKVVVGMVQTVVNDKRMIGFEPDVIICDEAHRTASDTHRTIIERFKWALVIGCSATIKRGDKQSLHACDLDGNPVKLREENGAIIYATKEDSVFEKLSYEYKLLKAMKDGYILEFDTIVCESETSLKGIKTQAGDYAEGELAKRINNAERTNLAINTWKANGCDALKTIVFCANVQHAHDACDQWRKAGYNPCAIDGTMEPYERRKYYEGWVNGEYNPLVNCQLFIEGVDAPAAACCILLRPTKSWVMLCQQVGRVLRPLKGVLDGLETAKERLAAIRSSAKPKAVIIDVCDIVEGNSPCSVPNLIDMPSRFKLEGHTLLETEKLLEEVTEEEKKQILKDGIFGYTELEVRVRRICAIKQQEATIRAQWSPSKEGYIYTATAPGYSAKLIEEEGKVRLDVRFKGDKLIAKSAPKLELRELLPIAKKHIDNAIQTHKESLVDVTKKFTRNQLYHLRQHHSDAQINAMSKKQASKLIGVYIQRQKAYNALHELESEYS